MKLENISEYISFVELVNFNDAFGEIEGVSYNSKKVEKNYIFVCLVGEHIDSHEFVQEAVDNGAIAVVANRILNLDIPQIIVSDTNIALAQIASEFYGNPSKKLNVIGVTGTNGKTTVTHLIQKLFEAENEKCALIGTLGYKLNSTDEKYLDCHHTTPQAPELQKLLYEINENCYDNVVMEVSSHSLVQHRVENIDFNGAVFTNLTQDHLDFHITMENYFKAKATLFDNLVVGDFAVINADDSYADRFLKIISPTVSTFTYGINKKADVMAKDLKFTDTGATFTCNVQGKEYPVSLIMNGMFSVYNVLAALTTALASGFNIENCIKTLKNIAGVAGRFEIITTKPTVIVDYAHTPDGLENVLKVAKTITPKDGKLICVFGCGGDRDATKRPKMGRIAESIADKIIITNDNPRSEDPQQIITDILAGLESTNNVIVEPDRELAIKLAAENANINDVVLVAGKGHEDYQILADKTIHFDDREKVREIFVGEE